MSSIHLRVAQAALIVGRRTAWRVQRGSYVGPNKCAYRLDDSNMMNPGGSQLGSLNNDAPKTARFRGAATVGGPCTWRLPKQAVQALPDGLRRSSSSHVPGSGYLGRGRSTSSIPT